MEEASACKARHVDPDALRTCPCMHVSTCARAYARMYAWLVIWVQTLCAPALCPHAVTRLASPPKAFASDRT